MKELKASLAEMLGAFVKMRADIRAIRKMLATTVATKADVRRILDAIEAVAQNDRSYGQRSLSDGAIITDHEDKLRDHGRRISTLETSS